MFHGILFVSVRKKSGVNTCPVSILQGPNILLSNQYPRTVYLQVRSVNPSNSAVIFLSMDSCFSMGK